MRAMEAEGEVNGDHAGDGERSVRVPTTATEGVSATLLSLYKMRCVFDRDCLITQVSDLDLRQIVCRPQVRLRAGIPTRLPSFRKGMFSELLRENLPSSIASSIASRALCYFSHPPISSIFNPATHVYICCTRVSHPAPSVVPVYFLY